jgi:M6 family metalloprotease-like protein
MKNIIFMCAGAIASLLLFTGCENSGGSTATLTMPLDKKISTYTSSGTPTSRPMLVIRLEYDTISFENNETVWSEKIFGDQFHQLNDYYREISNGLFTFSPVSETEDVENDGVVTVHLFKEHPDSGYSSIIHSDLRDAIIQADATVNFADYDTNGDGLITPDEMLIVFIVAGYEQAFDDTLDPGVWAHQSCVLSDNIPEVDGVKLMGCAFGGNYALFGERHGDHDATIGIIAHELGHAAFRLLDLYPTDPSVTSSGIGYFGLMGAGNWARADGSEYFGNTPVHMCAWSKIHSGWLEPQIENNVTNQTVTLAESASADYNVVKVAINADEYFLLENRNNNGYDRGLFSLNGIFDGGMAIWHVDESVIAAKSLSNTVNNDETHKGVDMEEAAEANLDNFKFYPGHEKNLYYAGNVDTFSPDTDPNTDSYASGETGIIIDNITERGVVMSADITNPN